MARFEDGNRHDVYQVSYVDASGLAADLVVRVSLGDNPIERRYAEREAVVLERLDGVGAPKLLDFRLSSPWFTTPVLSMGFVPGRSLDLRSATAADTERLGSVVASVHAQPLDDLAPWFDETGTVLSYAERRLRHILQGVPWAREPLPALLRDRVRRAADVIQSRWTAWCDVESFRTHEKLRLLHGDIALGNVLWDPNPVLIDWEYARLGDPADEVAYLFDQNALVASQRKAFWRGYQVRTGSDVSLTDTKDRIRWWEPLTLLGSTLWWVERCVRRTEAQIAGTSDPAVPKDATYYFEEAENRLHRLERLLGPA